MNMVGKGMIRFAALACIGVLGAAAPGLGQTPQAPAGAADTSASHSNAQSEAGEPRATTSPDAPPAASHEEETPRTERRGQSAKAARKEEPAGKAEGADKAEGGGKSAATDRLELQTATVTGDREQPKVMYIVPWKRSDIGDLSGKPMNSLLDEALAPIDRDEFKREVMYYQAVRADASQNGAPARGQAGAQAPPR
jgi:hypothetical protein